jgi:hypothetical protein
MPGFNTAFKMYQSALSQPIVTATSGTIAADRNPCYIKVDTTAGAAALTLARPTKAGVFCAVSLETDGGDLTLTVTGGYNYDGDTSITFDDAGDFVLFYSIDVGGTLRWQVIRQEGTDAPMETLAVDTATIQAMNRPAVLTAEHGAGAIGTAFAPRTYRYTREGVIVTEIHVDLTGLASVATANDIIGLAAGGDAIIGRNVVATNGIIFRIEMICLELPATGDDDIDLVSGSAADDAYDEAVTNAAIEINAGVWAAGTMVITNVPAVTANYYYYLTAGAGDTAGTYTAGQFIIRTYGHALLA